MRKYMLYAVAAAVYLLFLGGLAAVIINVEDEEAMLMYMTFLSTGLITFTIIFALFVSKGSTSDRYREMYMSEDEDDRKSE